MSDAAYPRPDDDPRRVQERDKTAPTPRPAARRSPPSVLLVADDPVCRRLLEGALGAEGFSVRSLAAPWLTADALAASLPDLALVDLELPGGDGLDLVRALARRSVAVIALSSRAAEEEILGAYSAGAVDCVVKPFRESDLLARCRVHLGLFRRPPGPPAGAALLGRYTILRELARGGCGVVYLARDPERGEEIVALKVPLPDANDLHARARFVREAGVLATIRHPNVVAIRDLGMVGDRIYCAMEFVEGESVYARVRRGGALDEASVRLLARGLLGSLSAIERVDVLHRDIKPSNVILRGGSVADPVLIDFGLARWRTDPRMTSADIFVGTLGYAAPEVLQGFEADARSDLFSLGLTLRFALTGAEIFPERTARGLYHALASEPLPPLPGHLTCGFADFLRRLCARERDERPPAAAAALAALEQTHA
jgi:CheY-like chemotaxis protein